MYAIWWDIHSWSRETHKIATQSNFKFTRVQWPLWPSPLTFTMFTSLCDFMFIGWIYPESLKQISSVDQKLKNNFKIFKFYPKYLNNGLRYHVVHITHALLWDIWPIEAKKLMKNSCNQTSRILEFIDPCDLDLWPKVNFLQHMMPSS